jgi:hypothetical protein
MVIYIKENIATKEPVGTVNIIDKIMSHIKATGKMIPSMA